MATEQLLVYIMGPLFNDMERTRNRHIADLVESLGFATYLPQEDGGFAYAMIEARPGTKHIPDVKRQIFTKDVSAIAACHIGLALLDGAAPDGGMCVELGMAYTLHKVCIGLLTDSRTFDKYGINLMLSECLTSVANSEEQLKNDLLVAAASLRLGRAPLGSLS